jgi:hypothetical protein
MPAKAFWLRQHDLSEWGNDDLARDMVKLSRAGLLKDELEKRVREMSLQSARTVAEQLRLAYYQHMLRLIAPLPPETPLYSGYRIGMHLRDHQSDLREIQQILDYLTPKGAGIKARLPGELAIPTRAGQKGRRVTRRHTALRALQMKQDTNLTWKEITREVCDCPKRPHDKHCEQAVRQSVIGLKKLLSKYPHPRSL